MLKYIEYNMNAEKTIVFLHGAGIGGWMWKPNIDFLGDFHCIAVDLPGHGKSKDLVWQSFESTAEDVASLIALKGKNGVAHVVGLSLGGYIALHLLKASPDVVQRAVISGIQVGKIPYAWLIQLVGYILSPFLHNEGFIRINAKGLKIPRVFIDDYVAGAKNVSKHAFHAINKEALNFEFAIDDFPLNKEVLFLAGENEHKLVLSSLQYFQEFKKVESFVVDNVGHAWSIEKPKLFSDTVKNWINKEALPETIHRLPKK